MSTTAPVLNYHATNTNPDLRKAGILLIVWAVILIFLGLMVTPLGVLASFVALENHDVIGELLLVSVPLFILGITAIIWGISNLRLGTRLYKGEALPLRGTILLTLLTEIAAYIGSGLYLVICWNDQVWDRAENVAFAAVFFAFYFLWPVSLTVSRSMLKRATHVFRTGESPGR